MAPTMFSRRPLLLGPLTAAPALLGAVICSTNDQGEVAVRLTEVEAYDGALDAGSHAYRGRTARNSVMFGDPGHSYVYFTYGMHHCLNVVCHRAGTAGGVLLRAGQVVRGEELARSRRPAARAARDLARGPANLAQALGLDLGWGGVDLLEPGSRLRLERGRRVAPELVATGPRVGLRAAAEVPWRFWVSGDPTVSAYKAAAVRTKPAPGPDPR
ncbi:MAG: DNA-3-methyladenine glycosylase [Candidatus Nanopelagicales bacterium]